MQHLVTSIRQSLAAENWYAALFMALTIPDICSKLEHPESGSSGKRYKAWTTKYLRSAMTMDFLGREESFMTASDVWALRCAILHEGTDDVQRQRDKETLSRFRFVGFGSIRAIFAGTDVLVLSIAPFCEDVCKGVEQWRGEVSHCPDVQARILRTVHVELATFSPTPDVSIVRDA